jgi:hypothetical protein
VWTGLARRVLYGEWLTDLEARIESMVGRLRREAWGSPDVSANLYRQVYDAISAQYDAAGTVGHEEDLASAVMTATLDRIGWWQLMQRVERDTLALREHLVCIDRDPVDGAPLIRPVFADRVEARVRDADPTVPVAIRELRLREIEGKEVWCWDIVDAEAGIFVVVRADTGEGVIEADGTPIVGWPDHWREGGVPEGKPVLPYVVYHAAQTSRLWDPLGCKELVEGTLNLGVYYTYWGHVLRQCAHPQRWMAGWDVAGATVVGPDGKREAVGDPAMVLALVPTHLEAEGMVRAVGQWDPAADPVVFLEAVKAYEQRLVSFAGINPADQLRMSGDPRSGYAVSVSRDAQRQIQRRHEPQLRRGDLAVIERIARVLGLPESGWSITYAGIPLSPDERRARREDVIARLDAGLLLPGEAYQELNPGISLDDAEVAVAKIAAARRLVMSEARPLPL